ncbi:MAG TPA: SgcJ/EcaC family oxidoreductase [Candidatus Acidoferrales bacterium]|nr:SgcJ/EcaC family oxidoreductase [Candidatus Acidoferrales bacterium]
MNQRQTTDDHAKDRVAIEQTLERFLDAWNKHDAHAFAMTFTEDADFTNVTGVHAQGRANVETFHARVFATLFKDSHQTAQIRSIRFLTPDLASVDVDWQMTGAILPNGTPMPNRKGLLNWLMAKQPGGSWLIEIMHNTDLTNAPGAAK